MVENIERFSDIFAKFDEYNVSPRVEKLIRQQFANQMSPSICCTKNLEIMEVVVKNSLKNYILFSLNDNEIQNKIFVVNSLEKGTTNNQIVMVVSSAKFVCPFCDKSFSSERNFQSHIKNFYNNNGIQNVFIFNINQGLK